MMHTSTLQLWMGRFFLFILFLSELFKKCYHLAIELGTIHACTDSYIG